MNHKQIQPPMKKTMPKPDYKYNLKKYIAELPREIKITQIFKAIDISQDTYYRWINLTKDDTAQISADKLHSFAIFFSMYMGKPVTMLDLLNTRPVLKTKHISKAPLLEPA